MRSSSRFRLAVEWFGILACALLLLVWWLTAGNYVQYANRLAGFAACEGVIYVWLGDRRCECHDEWTLGSSANVLIEKWPRIGHNSRGHMVACVQTWLMCLVVAAATGYLWWRRREFPPGHCENCGYNLKGNLSGVCPECGRSRDDQTSDTCEVSARHFGS